MMFGITQFGIIWPITSNWTFYLDLRDKSGELDPERRGERPRLLRRLSRESNRPGHIQNISFFGIYQIKAKREPKVPSSCPRPDR